MTTCTGFALGIAMLWCDQPAVTTVIACPPKIDWPAADQKATAAELAKLPAGHPLRKLAVIAVRQRNVIDACKAAQQPAGK